MTQKKRRGAGDSAPSAPEFDPVPLRYRRDGLTPERQLAFIRALAECGCVRDACRRVGVSHEAMYRLARRPDGQSFRIAWDIAMDNAVRRIGDEAFSRCIHGVSVPHFYKGELIGEHRRYDEGLTKFILRYRDPLRYGKHLDRADRIGHPEEKPLELADALIWVESDARREAAGLPRLVVRDLAAADDYRPVERPIGGDRFAPFGVGREDDDLDSDDLDSGEPDLAEPGEGAFGPDGSSSSSTSGLGQGPGGERGAAAARGGDGGGGDPDLPPTGEAP
jgi:hypothetical protein